MQIQYILVPLQFLIVFVSARFDPCPAGRHRKAVLGESCDDTGDCEGLGVVCLVGQCRCHQYYVELRDRDGGNFCQKLPDAIGADCTETLGCRDPMFCRQGKCQCVRRGNSNVINGECVVATRIGDRCTRHTDCSAPFSACVNSRCTCISGTSSTRSGDSCTARPNCPSGSPPGAPCVRHTDSQELVENLMNSGSKADNCTQDQYCVTPDGSPFGHCCGSHCPLNTAPDARYSCAFDAESDKVCPAGTHFCHRMSGPGYAFAVCCPRPCQEPNSVYIKGKCYPPGFVNSPCERHEQCDAFQTMGCYNGFCRCKTGFDNKIDALTSRKNPPQTCQRKCGFNLGRDNICFEKVRLGEQCTVQEQCPGATSGCYRGRCRCRCGYVERAGTCVAPPNPTAAPGEQGATPAPKSTNILSQLLGQLFGGSGGRTG